MSESEEPDLVAPAELLGGVRANDVYVYRDGDEVTIDFVRLNPRNPTEGIVVARVAGSHWCILKLKQRLGEIE